MHYRKSRFIILASLLILLLGLFSISTNTKAANDPIANITFGPSTGKVGQTLTYTANVNGRGSPVTSGDIWVSSTDPNAKNPPPCQKDTSGRWCHIATATSTANNSLLVLSGSWTPTETGNYYIAVNGISKDGKCTGNPFSVPTGWSNCGTVSRLTLNVSAKTNNVIANESSTTAQSVINISTPLISNSDPNKKRLEVRVSRSVTEPGGKYYLYVFEKQDDYKNYNGELEVLADYCEGDNPTNCRRYNPKNWQGIRIVDGKGEANNPNAVSVNRAVFRPCVNKSGDSCSGNDSWDWSNEVQVNVTTHFGLFDTKNFWMIPESSKKPDTYPAVFLGTNFQTDNTAQQIQQFRTLVDFNYNSYQQICPGEVGNAMLITKDNKYGYWGSNFRYFKWREAHSEDFRLIAWKKNPGWHDEYLTSMGDNAWNFNPDPNKNFMDQEQDFTNWFDFRRYTPYDPAFPSYILAPRFVGKGWGLSVPQKYSGSIYADGQDLLRGSIPRGNIDNKNLMSFFCNQQINLDGQNLQIAPPTTGTWGIFIDVIDGLPDSKLSNKKIIRTQFLEDTSGKFFINKNAGNTREDWYFGEGIGLVRIDVKNFANQEILNSNKPESEKALQRMINLCTRDADCLKNSVMTQPHTRLTRYSLLDKIPGDLNGDGIVDKNEQNQLFAGYGLGAVMRVQSEENQTQSLLTGDLNADGKVNTADYILLLKSYKK